MYALLDHTAQIFLNPVTFTNDADAIRWFGNMVNSSEEKTNISLHPHQFTLFRLSDYDDKLGTYHDRESDSSGQPAQLITGVQVQEEQTKKYSVQDLVSMLKHEINKDNVTNIKEA